MTVNSRARNLVPKYGRHERWSVHGPEQRAQDAEKQREQKLSLPWTRAQMKLDTANDALEDACDAARDARLRQTLTRYDLFYATESDLREKNQRLMAENRFLRAENEKLRTGCSQVNGSDSDSG